MRKSKGCFILPDFIESASAFGGRKARCGVYISRFASDYQGTSMVKKSVLRIAIVRGNLYFCTRARLVLASKTHFDAGGA